MAQKKKQTETNLVHLKREGEPYIHVDVAKAVTRADGNIAVTFYVTEPPQPTTQEELDELLKKEKIDIPCVCQGQYLMSPSGFHTILRTLSEHAEKFPLRKKTTKRRKSTK